MVSTHAQGEQYSQGILWAPRVRYAFDPYNEHQTHEDLEWFERRIGPSLPTLEEVGGLPECGRLGQSIEGGGKRGYWELHKSKAACSLS